MKLFKKNNLLPLISPLLPSNPIVVEAGAFDGTDTKIISQFWPQGTIHAFEPVPEIFTKLKKNTSDLHNVVRHEIALSTATGNTTFYVSEKPSRPGEPFKAGSLLKPKERLKWSDIEYKKTINVPIITLDDWAQKNNVTHIDFMWLDVQGHALHILKAAPQLLKTIKILFVEVEFIQAYENQYQYNDVKTWLEQNGFVEIGRDFENTNKWFYGNALFRKK